MPHNFLKAAVEKDSNDSITLRLINCKDEEMLDAAIATLNPLRIGDKHFSPLNLGFVYITVTGRSWEHKNGPFLYQGRGNHCPHARQHDRYLEARGHFDIEHTRGSRKYYEAVAGLKGPSAEVMDELFRWEYDPQRPTKVFELLPKIGALHVLSGTLQRILKETPNIQEANLCRDLLVSSLKKLSPEERRPIITSIRHAFPEYDRHNHKERRPMV